MNSMKNNTFSIYVAQNDSLTYGKNEAYIKWEFLVKKLFINLILNLLLKFDWNIIIYRAGKYMVIASKTQRSILCHEINYSYLNHIWSKFFMSINFTTKIGKNYTNQIVNEHASTSHVYPNSSISSLASL